MLNVCDYLTMCYTCESSWKTSIFQEKFCRFSCRSQTLKEFQNWVKKCILVILARQPLCVGFDTNFKMEFRLDHVNLLSKQCWIHVGSEPRVHPYYGLVFDSLVCCFAFLAWWSLRNQEMLEKFVKVFIWRM